MGSVTRSSRIWAASGRVTVFPVGHGAEAPQGHPTGQIIENGSCAKSAGPRQILASRSARPKRRALLGLAREGLEKIGTLGSMGGPGNGVSTTGAAKRGQLNHPRSDLCSNKLGP